MESMPLTSVVVVVVVHLLLLVFATLQEGGRLQSAIQAQYAHSQPSPVLLISIAITMTDLVVFALSSRRCFCTFMTANKFRKRRIREETVCSLTSASQITRGKERTKQKETKARDKDRDRDRDRDSCLIK